MSATSEATSSSKQTLLKRHQKGVSLEAGLGVRASKPYVQLGPKSLDEPAESQRKSIVADSHQIKLGRQSWYVDHAKEW